MRTKVLIIALQIAFISLMLQACGVIGLSGDASQPTPKRAKKIERSSSESSKENKEERKEDDLDPPSLVLGGKTEVFKHSSPVFLEEGVASWYGPNFHGKRTANGETYDMDGITAAHRTLSFNSLVRVTNLENGKSVKVRINDRGPYAKERIIDLSKEAAKKLDMIQDGTARVRLELVEGKMPNLSTFCSLCETFAVQLGAFGNEFDAKIESDKIEGSYIQKSDINGKIVYRIFYGAYKTKEEAAKALEKFRRQGFDGFVKQLDNL